MEIHEVTSSPKSRTFLKNAIDGGYIDGQKLSEFRLIKNACYEVSTEEDPERRELAAVLNTIDFGGTFESLKKLSIESTNILRPIEYDIGKFVNIKDTAHTNWCELKRQRAIFLSAAAIAYSIAMYRKCSFAQD